MLTMAFPDTYRWDTAEARRISNRDLVTVVADTLGAAA